MLASPATSDLAERTDEQHAALDRLLGLTMSMATMVHDRAKAQEEVTPPESEAQPAARAAPAFDRLARTARHTIMLSQRLDAPLRARIAGRRRIIRHVEDAIQREAPSPNAQERLNSELFERLETLGDEIDLRPGAEADIAAEICRDLGLASLLPGMRPYKRRTPADIALLNARAAQSSTQTAPNAAPAPSSTPRSGWPSAG